MFVKSKEYSYGFVVLNYNNYQDTIACVNSILQLSHRDDYYITIVDNASSNNSFDILKSEFEGHIKITLIHANQNGGYSSGNNIGIRFLLKMGIVQIVIATNDTEIISTNILEVLDKLDLSGVGIVGTDVLTPDGIHQNPPLHQLSILYCLNLYLYEPMAAARKKLYLFFPFILRFRRRSIAKKIEYIGDISSPIDCVSVYMLHGCFLLLTEAYLSKAGLLDEHLFMYGEEDLMAWNCEFYGLKRLYLPNVKVMHKDGQSTKIAHKKNKEEFVRMMTIQAKNYLVKKIDKWALLKVLLRGI